MPGRLIVCPTPIGNLEDMTPRARRTLAEVDVVACEDTRRAGRLFELLEMEAPPLVSYHEHNEDERALDLAQRIERGERVALISDSGMPGISDPGYRLIRTCIDRSIEVQVLPGPSAVPVAVVASGLPAGRWRFEGFLPRRPGAMERVLQSVETVVAFESPRRLPESLAALAALAPDRPAAVCRELTKLHEEVWRGTLADAAAWATETPPRGEIALVVEGGPEPEAPSEDEVEEALRMRLAAGMRTKDAAAEVAAELGLPKRDVYAMATRLA